MNIKQLFLLIYLVLFYGTAFFWRSWQTWRATGINPYRLNSGDSLHRYVGQLYRIITFGLAVTVLVFSFVPAWYVYFSPIGWLETAVFTSIGIFLSLTSLVWVLVAQAQMGKSWRIGIDREHETQLVTKGIFGWSRNPIFVGMRLNLLGLFLILPNAITLSIWVLGDVLIQIQVIMEENFLLEQHGATYEQYRHRVRRWI